jgi:hypothetical protein
LRRHITKPPGHQSVSSLIAYDLQEPAGKALRLAARVQAFERYQERILRDIFGICGPTKYRQCD